MMDGATNAAVLRFPSMRTVLIAALLAALPGLAAAQMAPPPVLPPPLYAQPPVQPPVAPPASQPQGLQGPTVVPGMGGLYNVLTYGQHGPRCTPSPLVPTACH